MKTILKIIGYFIASALSVGLMGLIVAFVAVSCIKTIVSKDGIVDILKDVDIVETIKANNDDLWNDLNDSFSEANLSESQVEQLLGNEQIKNEIASYISRGIDSISTGEPFLITKEDLEKTINIAVDEYNKVADKKITTEERQSILDSIDQDVLDEFNSEMEELNFNEELKDSPAVIKFASNVIFKNATTLVFIAIVVVTLLIALFTFSVYRWMPFSGASSLSASIILFISGFALGSIDVISKSESQLFTAFYNQITGMITRYSIILFVIAIILFVVYHFVKKINKNKLEENV